MHSAHERERRSRRHSLPVVGSRFPDPLTMSEDTPTAPSDPIVVGIGASAGGLNALKKLFDGVSVDSGLAYVVIVHLSPEHVSHLAALLQSHLAIPVLQVTETVELEPNHVYVIPPGANLEAVDTHLRLADLEERRGERAPIDHFFHTLARTRDGHAVGVVLTGTGSDGTVGLQEIKGEGGLTVVQDPDEAEYGGMPRSALATGAVDLVLPLAEIAGAILRYVRTEPRVPVLEEDRDLDEDERSLLQKIVTRLLAQTGRDFSRYKRSTLLRRIRHRMQLHQLEEIAAYVDLLAERPDEIGALGDELLVTVTRFFRDREVFEVLEERVIPGLFEGKGPGDQIRVWSVGCATGEEPYSLAMLLLEAAERRQARPQIQIFASDIHGPSIRRARTGLYAGDIEADVSPTRLERFFRKENGGYRIRDDARELVVFSLHDLLEDPPFSHLDLVVCRNLLIYLGRDAQRSVMEILHYALDPEGVLVLGAAETAVGSDLFRTVDKGHHVYRAKEVGSRPEPRLPVFSPGILRRPEPAFTGRGDALAGSRGAVHQRLVERLAPPSLVVDADDEVVHLSERAGRYLSHPGGEPTTSLTKLVREEIRVELAAALHDARATGEPVRSRPVKITLDDGVRRVVVDARPSPEPTDEGLVLVIFDERPHPADEVDEGSSPDQKASAREGPSPEETSRVRELESELSRTRRRLRAVIENYETSREEMRASNEELQSMNEELRSTMEELETSKEELQSMNEELQTVNQENRHKVEELAQLSGDLRNLLKATDIATLFLDRDLRIMRFTPQVTRLFNLKEGDRGRPISDLTHRLGYDELTSDAGKVLDRLTPIEREVRDQEGRWYLTRIMPYRSPDDRIEGVVITFVDITGRKEIEEELREAKTFAESVVETLHEPLLVLTDELRVKSANPAFYAEFGGEPGEVVDRDVVEIHDGRWDIPELVSLLDELRLGKEGVRDFEIEHDFDDAGRRVMLVNAGRLEGLALIVLGIRDITEQKRLEQRMRQKDKMEAVGRLAGGVAHDFNNLLTTIEGQATLLLDEVEDDSAMRDDLEGIREAGRRAASLTRKLLAFGREQALRARRVPLGATVLEIREMLRSFIPERIELRVAVVGDEDPVVRADPGQLQEVALNLVVNAVDAIDDRGSVTVEVDTVDLQPDQVRTIAWEIEAGRYARLAVRDTGSGMTEEEIERIFEPFFTTKERGESLGLGLSTVYGIVKQSGGHVFVESTPDGGTTFNVLLPREPESRG